MFSHSRILLNSLLILMDNVCSSELFPVKFTLTDPSELYKLASSATNIA